MFSLIITIISIGLVAVLALATLYYGGESFMKGHREADNARIIQEGAQISGAFELYKTDNNGDLPAGTAAQIQQQLLDKGYLKSWPGAKWDLKTDYAVREVASVEQCVALNKKMGYTSATVPSCSAMASTFPGKTLCCTDVN